MAVQKINVLQFIRKHFLWLLIALLMAAGLLYFFNAIRNNSLSENVISLDEEWTVSVNGDSKENCSLQTFKLPALLNVGDSIKISKTITTRLNFSEALRFRVFLSTVEVKVNGKSIYSYGQDNFKEQKLVGSGYHFIPLPVNVSRQRVEITFVAAEEAAFTNIPAIELLPASEAVPDFYARHAFEVLIGFFLVVLGACLIVVSLVAFGVNKNYYRLVLIGGMSFLIGFWTLCNTKTLQIFSSNLAVNTILEYITLYLAPILFALLILDMRKELAHWKQVSLRIIIVLDAVFCVTATILQATNLLHYPATLTEFHIFAFLCFAFLVLSGTLFDRSANISEKIFASGIVIFALFGLVDLIRFNLQKYVLAENIYMEDTWLPMGAFAFVVILLVSYLVYLYNIIMTETEKEVLTTLAFKDSLTGLYNRAMCEKIFDDLNENKKVYTIISIDVNGLKQVNDSLGHAVGDSLLLVFSKVLTESFENVGSCIRMGGDEFVVVIEEEKMPFVADAIARLVELENSTFVTTDVCLSASYGIAASNEAPTKTADAVYRIADERMYKMKALSKNKS